ncbi:hypothetical protein RYX36_029859, partial [Vicia faba]
SFGHFKSFRFVFGFDDSTKTYKVVAFHVQVENNAQRRVWLKFLRWVGLHASGTLNSLAHKYFHSFYNDKYILDVEQFVIISLDLSTETYKDVVDAS